MKTAKHILYIAAFILVVAALTTGCAKERLVKKTTTGETYKVTLEVGCSDTRTTITQHETENKLPVVWKPGDKLFVAGATDGYMGELTLTEIDPSDSHKATFNGDLTWTSEEDQILHIYYLGEGDVTIDQVNNQFTFDISSQKGTLAEIAKNGYVAHAATPSAVAKGTKSITVGTMDNLNAVILFDLSAWTSGVTISGTYNKAVLNLKTGKFNTTDCKGEIVISAANCSTKTYVTFIPDVTAIVFQSGSSRTASANNSMEAGKFYSRNGDPIKIPTMYLGDGALGEMFSVSPRKKVYFSRGNLWTNTTAGHQSWSFETEQYYYPTGQYDSTHVSRFYWSNEGNYGSNRIYVAPTSDVDWGVPYCNANGLAPGTWRTLSGNIYGEWEYLLDKRTGNRAPEIGTQTDARYAEVKVNNIPGVLVFPDVFTWPSDVATIPTKFNTYSSTWNSVNYSTADFAKLETAGCLFLPAAGYRDKNNTAFTNVATAGYYRSTTIYTTSSSYNLYFTNNSFNSTSTNAYTQAFSVRLVKDASEEPLPHYIDDKGDHGAGIEINNVIWAPVNCGTDAEHPNGLMYQFGRKVGGGYNDNTYTSETAQTKVSASTRWTDNGCNKTPADNEFYYGGNETTIDWYTGTKSSQLTCWPQKSTDIGYIDGKIDNPCPKGWRVPTEEEFKTLLNNSTTSTTTSTWEIPAGQTINGRTFYGNTQKTGPSIFLPANGYIQVETGNSTQRGSEANYYSSSVSGIYARKLNFNNSSVCEINIGRRAQGNAVRCVYDANTLPLTSTVTANSFTDRVSW